jgi:hypothetical protein
MRIRRTFPIVLAVVVIAAALTLAVQLRKHAPPEAARLLPGADGFFYLNLSAARKANSGSPLPAERDLDEAAFAIHYPAGWPGGGTGASAPEPRFSEVLVGKFHGEQLTGYLRQIAKSVENYHSVEIFTILLEGRSLRVALLSADSVAASNHDDPAVIEGMIDRSRRLASPFGGPWLLRQYYKHVQLASLAWVVARVEPSVHDAGVWSTLFAKPAIIVVSGSYLSPLHLMPNAIHLRAEAFTQSPDDARSITDKVTLFVDLTRTAEVSVGTHGTDADVKALFDSLKIRQEDDRAILTAAVPLGFLRKMMSGLPAEVSEPAAAQPAQVPAKSR